MKLVFVGAAAGAGNGEREFTCPNPLPLREQLETVAKALAGSI